MNSTTALDDLQRQAVSSLGRYFTVPESERTEALRETAGHFISAREHFFTREGAPDWLGRTYAYRSWVREVMSEARVPSDDISTVQSAIRYHTGNVLRDRLDDDTLDALGLRPSSPRERSVEKRERNSETLALFGGGSAITDAGDMLQAAKMIETFLRRVRISELTPTERKDVVVALREACKRVDLIAEEAARRRGSSK